MLVAIPTLSRAEKQSTLKRLNLKSKMYNVKLIIDKAEHDLYAKTVGEKIILDCDVSGIANTRQWVLDQAYEQGYKYVLFLDDDMTFNSRKPDGKLTVASNKEVDDMIQLLISWLDKGFVHVGISARGGNNRVTEDFTEIARMNNAYAYNVSQFHKLGIRFNRLKVMEDFDTTLQILKLGYPNRVTYKYAWGQGGSGETGGCSNYRTPEMQHEAAVALRNYHPGLVNIKMKRSKTSWPGWPKDSAGYTIRTDVNINWQKAYRIGQKIKERGGGFRSLFSG